MSCKSAVYAASASTITVAANSIIPVGQIVRKFGCGIQVMPNSIILKSTGYYYISVNVTAIPDAAGDVSVTLLKDGLPVPGAVATQTTANTDKATTMNISAIVRKTCCAEASNLRLAIDEAGQVSNVSVTVIKL